MEEIVKILIADDNKAIVEFMQKYIAKDDRYKIVGICSDTETEIKMIDELKPDVVITDIRKKNKWSGIDIVKKYIDSEYCPIFYIVSASVVHYLPEMRDLKIRHYLTKPFEEKDFMRILGYAYSEIYPKEIVSTQKEIAGTPSKIIEFFRAIKKRIGV